MNNNEMLKEQQVVMVQVGVIIVKAMVEAGERFELFHGDLDMGCEMLQTTTVEKTKELLSTVSEEAKLDFLANFLVAETKKQLKVPLMICAMRPEKYESLINDLESNIRKVEMGVEL